MALRHGSRRPRRSSDSLGDSLNAFCERGNDGFRRCRKTPTMFCINIKKIKGATVTGSLNTKITQLGTYSADHVRRGFHGESREAGDYRCNWSASALCVYSGFF